jgi:hypothetical protein
MKRHASSIAFLVALIGWAGCGSSGSTSAPSDMDALAAVSDQHRASNTATATGSQPTVSNPQATSIQTSAPQPAATPATPVAVDPSLASKRGFDLKDWSNEAAYVLVKADVAKTADALAAAWKGKVIKDVFGTVVPEHRALVPVFQLAGHRWSIFATDNSQLEMLSAALSRDTDVLVAWNSDFNGWSGVGLYRGGQEVEAIHWGGVDEKLGEDANASLWHAEGQIPRKFEDIEFTDSFLFRSKLRKMTPQELQKGEAVVDAMLRANDAYLPDADQMPWTDADEQGALSSPLGPAAFKGVYAVEIDEPN